MTNTSVTLQETGIADAINDGGPYDSARNKMIALDFATQPQEMKAIAGQPDYALGSVHAVTRDGALVIASASGSQLASYAWGAANVIFVVGAQKLVPDPEAARERIYEHSLKLEDARALRRLRAEQLRRQDPRDPPGDARPHPRRPHPSGGRVLMTSDTRQEQRMSTESRWTRRSITSAARRPAGSSSSTATTNAPTRGRRFERSSASSNELGGGIRFAFRHFPLDEIHPHALAAAAAAEAAALQDRFWDMHELLFHRQKALEDDDLRRYAAELGLDVARFDQDRSGAASWSAFAATSRAEWRRARCAAHRRCSSTASCTAAATTRRRCWRQQWHGDRGQGR